MKNQITIVGLRTEVYPVLMVTCRADHVTQAPTSVYPATAAPSPLIRRTTDFCAVPLGHMTIP